MTGSSVSAPFGADAALPGRAFFEAQEERRLRGAAQKSARSGGRIHDEPPHAFRTAYQRDRDRIIHSSAFRRLQYKTQVFVNPQGDHYRTRLTHTLEVAQIARTLSRALRLNEDLTEAVTLAHDMGHAPFGHVGEDALDEVMRPFGGFEHNLQSFRIVEYLERQSPAFPGLNLTRETRHGVFAHSPRPAGPPEGLEGFAQPPLEAQVGDAADEIAYATHDIEDGILSGLVAVESLEESALFRRHWRDASVQYREHDLTVRVKALRGRIIGELSGRLIEESDRRIRESGVEAPEDPLRVEAPLVGLDEPLAGEVRELKKVLLGRMYRHPRVLAMTDEAKKLLPELFDAYRHAPERMPENVQRRIAEEGRTLERGICDYIAGMTDRFAQERHRAVVGGRGSAALPDVAGDPEAGGGVTIEFI